MKHANLSLVRVASITAALLLVVASWLPAVQERAVELTDQGLNRALVTFGVARGLNAAVSIIQGTEIAVQPFGMGATLSLGQVLDPIDDLVEEFSSLMLFASVAFGVQKLLLKIAGAWVVSSLVTAIALVWAGLLIAGRSYPWLTRLFVIAFLVRLAIPIVTIGSGFVFDQLLAEEYATSQQSLEKTTSTIEAAKPDPQKVTTGPERTRQGDTERFAWITEQLELGKKWIADKMPDFKFRVPHVEIPDFDSIKEAATSLPKRIAMLIAVFVMQTVALPILLLWFLYRLSFAGALRTGSPGHSFLAA